MSLVDSPYFVWLILLIGLLIALWRPVAILPVITFFFAAFPINILALSRTVLGGYFNAIDALLLIGLVATVLRSTVSKNLYVPKIVILILAVLLIAFLQSLSAFGPTYETARSLRWSLTFPVLFFIAANLTSGPKVCGPLLVAIISGTFCASLLGLGTVADQLPVFVSSNDNYALVRSASLVGSSMFLLPTILLAPRFGGKQRQLLMLLLAVVLSLNIILSQTRSMWFAIALSIPCIVLVMQTQQRWMSLIRVVIVWAALLLIALSIAQHFMPQYDIVQMIAMRTMELGDPEGTSLSRRLAVDVELRAWLDSAIVVGKGLSYFQREIGSGIAYNHIGYLTYLAQLGLFGLLVYGVLVPLLALREAKYVYHLGLHLETWSVSFLALLSSTIAIYYVFISFMSGSYLSHAPLPGLVMGSVWMLARMMKQKDAPKLTTATRPLSVFHQQMY